MSTFSGSNLVVKIGTHNIVCATSCTLTINQETITASCKDSGKWTDGIAGKGSWSISTDNLYDPDITKESFDKLAQNIIDDADGGTENKMLLVFEIEGAVAPNITVYGGTGMLTDIALTGNDNELATYTANFTGLGKLTQTPQT